MNRGEAKIAGLKKYNNGKPCPVGHIGDRLTSNGSCVLCQAKSRIKYHADNRKSENEKRMNRYTKNKLVENNYCKAKYWDNPDVGRDRIRRWRLANPEKVAENTLIRLRHCGDRVPAWADVDKIKEIYKEAKLRRRLGEDVHVDHEIPLRGKRVSGLHVHTNLRVIPAHENLAKGASCDV